MSLQGAVSLRIMIILSIMGKVLQDLKNKNLKDRPYIYHEIEMIFSKTTPWQAA